MIQVAKTHYSFDNYMSLNRWCSIWHQLNILNQLAPASVLEIGPGLGILKTAGELFGINIKTLDIDPELKPDYIDNVTQMKFNDGEFEAVCSFQMLEHLPYEISLLAFSEMVRVSSKYIVISLPDSKQALRYFASIPKCGHLNFIVENPIHYAKEHIFDGEHYWEINKRGYSLSKIKADFENIAKLVKTFRIKENHYHRFFVFKKNDINIQ